MNRHITGTFATLLLLTIWSAPLQGQGKLSHSTKKDTLRKKIRFTILPAGGYEPETSFKIGLAGFMILNNSMKEKTQFHRPSTVSMYFMYTFRKQILSKVKWQHFFENGLNLSIQYQYFDYPENYFGIGNDTSPQLSTQFINKFYGFKGQLYKQINEKTFSGITYDIQHNLFSEVSSNSPLINESTRGLRGGRTIGVGPAFKYDSRDNAFYPTRGSFISAEVSVVSEIMGSEYDYVQYQLDTRKYFPIKNESNVLALQTNFRFTTGGEIPFYKMPTLGGIYQLRGIENSRLYRDRQMMYFQLEYRRQLPWRLGLAGFIGVGDVAHNLKGFDIGEFKQVGGIGVRYAMMKDQRLNLRLDYGFGSGKQSAFYIAIKEAF